MKLANLLLERRITLDLKSRTKDDAVRELIDMIRQEGVKLDFESVLGAIREREEIENTSYGHGFAFPHARTDAVGEMFILIGVSRTGLEGKTSDQVPVHVVCLLLTPSTIAKLYLQTLSGLATFARLPGTLDKVKAAGSPADIVKLISDANVTVDKELMVKDVMRHHVATVRPDDTLKDVANQMFRHRLSALAVVDDAGKLVGIINDRDLIKVALPDYKALISNLNYSMDVEPFEELLKQEDKIKVSELYRTDYEVTTPETRIVEVAAMMIFKDVRRVFVSQKGKLVGVLLRKDIVNMVIRG
ncbi:MAG: PTS sugar transporter subunit IIA [candidate division Zixibacteria bacterium]|nr:PTS sugar transporter subunit IIA [candidate division Zixibacteria bacterium]